jgi:hypothetical protein
VTGQVRRSAGASGRGSRCGQIATSPPRSGVAISRPQQFCGLRIDLASRVYSAEAVLLGVEVWGRLLSFLRSKGRNEEVRRSLIG